MLGICLVFSLCILAIHASGEFSVLSGPKSLAFKGNDALQSQYVGDVLYTALGNAVAGDAQWSGLIINDPFNLATSVVAIKIDGLSHINVGSSSKTYGLQGSGSDESLNLLSAQLEADNEPVCDMNFEQYDEAVANFMANTGNVTVAPVAKTKYLNGDLHTSDKQFLKTLAYIDAITDNMADLQKKCKFVSVRLSLDGIAKAHGEKSEAMQEASKLVSAVSNKLNAVAQKSSNNEALVVAIASKTDSGRAKREAVAPNEKNPYNLAEYYNEDYPVIFNIILWFMVTFGFALLAICYAIGSMDPGRDSIIYRMTSTRMKKDN